MTPIQRYQQDLQRPDFVKDEAQAQGVEMLQRVYDELLAMHLNDKQVANGDSGGGLFGKIGRKFGFGAEAVTEQATAVKGLYFWGGVGRGKTYLVDTFYDALPLENKMRLHFHHFMYRVHDELKQLRDTTDPLKIVSAKLAEEACLICLDEFFVSDITDAMLLAGLLDGLHKNGVTLITTSNIPPDNLYKNGLQRARFMPAIEHLKTELEVFNLDGGEDYRTRYLSQAKVYHTPLSEESHEKMLDSFEHLCPDEGETDKELMVEGRAIKAQKVGDGVAWFDFTALCDGPRSPADYIELARSYHSVLLSDVPVLDFMMENQARRFLNMVDEFYDRNVNLIISAEAPLDSLYQGKKLVFEYQRALSRLQEMQSVEYLAQAHVP